MLCVVVVLCAGAFPIDTGGVGRHPVIKLQYCGEKTKTRAAHSEDQKLRVLQSLLTLFFMGGGV